MSTSWKNRVLLINGPVPVWCASNDAFRTAPPLGPLYLASALEQAGYAVRFADLMASPMRETNFTALLNDFEPDVVGISVNVSNSQLARPLASAVKAALPRCYVVAGGSYPTFAWKEMLEGQGVDFIVLHEGEESLLELVKCLEQRGRAGAHDVPGIAFRQQGGKPCRTAHREFIRDLDSIAFPSRYPHVMRLYDYPASLITSRGCPSRCTFCSSAAFWHRTVRFRSAGNIADEIERLKARFPDEVLYICDDTMTLNRERVRQLCREIIRRGIDVEWYCNARVDTVTPELLAEMRSAGCRKVLFGFESGDDRVLRSIKKDITVAQIERAVRWATEARIMVSASYMVGHPADTPESVTSTIEFSRHLRQTYECKTLGWLNTPFPGTPQFLHADELGLDVQLGRPDDYLTNNPLVGTRHLPRKLFEQFRGTFSVFSEDLVLSILNSSGREADQEDHTR